MSHYCVAVITDNPDNIDKIMEPFDENKEVDFYIKYTKEQLIEKGKKEIQVYKNSYYKEFLDNPKEYEKEHGKNTGHINYIKNEFPKRLVWTDEEILENQVKFYKDDNGNLYSRNNETKEEYVDKNFNLWSANNPESKWDWWEIGGRWNGELITKTGNKNEALLDDVLFDKMNERQIGTKEEFAEKSWSTYAVITPDGEWHEAGEMGWFGISYATPQQEKEFNKNWYKNFIEPYLNSDYYIIIVDCHI
jgi:hypothetical protein